MLVKIIGKFTNLNDSNNREKEMMLESQGMVPNSINVGEISHFSSRSFWEMPWKSA